MAAFARTNRVIAIGTPASGSGDFYRTQRCRCSLHPFAESLRSPTLEQIEACFAPQQTVPSGGAATDPELEAAKHWPAQGSTCAHVCGPDPGHVCDARATTTLRHPLPSGGTRDLPLCGPCHLAETGEQPKHQVPVVREVGETVTIGWDSYRTAESSRIDTDPSQPPVDRLFVVAGTRVQFTEWCRDLGISPQDHRVVHVTGQPGQLEGHARGLRYLVLAYPPGRAALAIMEALRSRDAVQISDAEFAPWRAALQFAEATRRLVTSPGETRREVERLAADIRALYGDADAEIGDEPARGDQRCAATAGSATAAPPTGAPTSPEPSN